LNISISAAAHALGRRYLPLVDDIRESSAGGRIILLLVKLVRIDGMGLQFVRLPALEEFIPAVVQIGKDVPELAVGIAQAAFDKAQAYTRQRKTSEGPISEFQIIQQKLADAETGIAAARLLTYHAAMLKEKGEEAVSPIFQAKLFASEMAIKVCDDAIQIHGGYGYTDGFDVHRHWRDARLLTIGEGTSEALRLLIAHLALKEQ